FRCISRKEIHMSNQSSIEQIPAQHQTKEKRKTKRWYQQLTISKIIAYVVLLSYSIFFIFTFYWILIGSFMVQVVVTAIPPEWFPLQPILENWVTLFNNPVWRWTFNSFIIAGGEMLGVCFVSATAGYVLAKKVFPGRRFIFVVLIAAMMLPKQ